MAKVTVTVVGGKCQGNYHKIGDSFEIGSTTPQGMCLGAFGAILSYVKVLLYDGSFPWSEPGTRTRISCPDPKGIVLEIERGEG